MEGLVGAQGYGATGAFVGALAKGGVIDAGGFLGIFSGLKRECEFSGIGRYAADYLRRVTGIFIEGDMPVGAAVVFPFIFLSLEALCAHNHFGGRCGGGVFSGEAAPKVVFHL